MRYFSGFFCHFFENFRVFITKSHWYIFFSCICCTNSENYMRMLKNFRLLRIIFSRNNIKINHFLICSRHFFPPRFHKLLVDDNLIIFLFFLAYYFWGKLFLITSPSIQIRRTNCILHVHNDNHNTVKILFCYNCDSYRLKKFNLLKMINIWCIIKIRYLIDEIWYDW